ncbi:response regulator [Halovulum dunhuangense]|uniref:Response regulator n=1 Tax=Halovulum dunhuangense TaxID=1505036 RepID=A0A849L1J9_9RHOB|nr:response regulator [Halovulum dunhuangense]NNU80135.1 response regulator [Halovulum dunhuangense]
MDRKIVIAEDEAYLRLLIQQSIEELEDEGVEIFVAQDGPGALALIEREAPQLILLDVMMPGMNGFEVCERVRANRDLPQPYIILLTAKGQEYDKIRGTEAGADRYMTKPFNPDDLLDAARAVVC